MEESLAGSISELSQDLRRKVAMTHEINAQVIDEADDIDVKVSEKEDGTITNYLFSFLDLPDAI